LPFQTLPRGDEDVATLFLFSNRAVSRCAWVLPWNL